MARIKWYSVRITLPRLTTWSGLPAVTFFACFRHHRITNCYVREKLPLLACFLRFFPSFFLEATSSFLFSLPSLLCVMSVRPPDLHSVLPSLRALCLPVFLSLPEVLLTSAFPSFPPSFLCPLITSSKLTLTGTEMFFEVGFMYILAVARSVVPSLLWTQACDTCCGSGWGQDGSACLEDEAGWLSVCCGGGKVRHVTYSLLLVLSVPCP